MSHRLRASLIALSLLVALDSVSMDRVRAEESIEEVPLAADPLLIELRDDTLARRPELRRSEALARAEGERIAQGRGLPDPVLSLAVQNDGFRRWMIGQMETSWYEIMLSQGVPFPGKRALRSDVAALSQAQAHAYVGRVRLSTEAEVRRTYLALLLARDRLSLLDDLQGLWHKAAQVARVRYEAGEGTQSDVLRAQLEVNRLRQRRWAVGADEQLQLQALNRLRGRPLETPIPTTASVRALAAPRVLSLDEAMERAAQASPELAAAKIGEKRAGRAIALSRRERLPDFNVSAGIMPRGQLEPMWRASIGVGLPVWSSLKQNRALAESEARAEAEGEAVSALEELLRQRVAERRAVLGALVQTIGLYRDGLLVQSRATADSTLAQYRVGKVNFSAVLDANVGYLGDEDAYLLAVADAQRIAIAGAEITLDAIGVAPGGTMGSVTWGSSAASGMGGMGGSRGSSEPAGKASESSSAPSSSGMGM